MNIDDFDYLKMNTKLNNIYEKLDFLSSLKPSDMAAFNTKYKYEVETLNAINTKLDNIENVLKEFFELYKSINISDLTGNLQSFETTNRNRTIYDKSIIGKDIDKEVSFDDEDE